MCLSQQITETNGLSYKLMQNLMHRYNLSLAQGALLNSMNIVVKLPSSTPPARLRQLTRWLKFQRLLCAVDKNKTDGLTLHIDGPLSLFRTTQKYGFQIALFLPALLLCPEFELEAELLWGKTKKPCKFQITSNSDKMFLSIIPINSRTRS